MFSRYDGTQRFKDRVDAFFRLTDAQRTHYHMKNGFRLPDDVSPTKANFSASEDITAHEKVLFLSVPDADWPFLNEGFGKKLSNIFVGNQFRPSHVDRSSLNEADRVEMTNLIDAIYERI